MKPEFTFVRRLNRNGIKCVAPFINRWNVWDIPEKEFTPAVETAIINAYKLGAMHLRTELEVEMNNIASSMQMGSASETRFKEKK